ncbi:hypothetical protein [Kitasatospora sp. NPDC050543]|uniref:hypothetical protein n=1 Tax=Kitasatospora sp. NPDC050543 TaxID=3364054 RepID=UPI0037AB66D6
MEMDRRVGNDRGRGGLLYRVRTALAGVGNTEVVLLLGLSLGLGAVGAQVASLPVLVVFSVVWGVTVVALVGLALRWIGASADRSRQRASSHPA